ncbi:MAG: MEDS domain-containing protein [Nitrospirota bacterium]
MSHAVQFYHDDVFLIDAVSAFIRAGYEEHATIIVVVTEQHRKDLRTRFQKSDQAEIEATVMYIDAVELLSAFMVDGWPDQTRFIAGLQPILQQATLRGPIRIFGEMVAVLWAQGNTRGAIRLEDLWNELAANYPFSLLCAYPMSSFPDQKADLSFLQVCHSHTHVHLSEQTR